MASRLCISKTVDLRACDAEKPLSGVVFGFVKNYNPNGESITVTLRVEHEYFSFTEVILKRWIEKVNEILDESEAMETTTEKRN